jgi:hypothetical protein
MDASSLTAFLAVRPDLVPLMFMTGAIFFAIGYSRRHRTASGGRHLEKLRTPGWLARRRARGGIGHKHNQVGVGHTSAIHTVRLPVQALAIHGYIGGAPGAGKTSALRLLIQGFPGLVIALDAKRSPDLANTVWNAPGHVWEMGGALKLDVLDPEPTILAQQLLEG